MDRIRRAFEVAHDNLIGWNSTSVSALKCNRASHVCGFYLSLRRESSDNDDADNFLLVQRRCSTFFLRVVYLFFLLFLDLHDDKTDGTMMLVMTGTGFCLLLSKKAHVMSRNVSDNFGFILLSVFQIQLSVKWVGCNVQCPRHADMNIQFLDSNTSSSKHNKTNLFI